MICIKTEIPKYINEIDDELKAIYHSNDCFCIWVFNTRKDRIRFMDETVGMMKDEREAFFEANYVKENN
tara:strand:- start:352 stop:558 length:207 start_codon:yes stop_codon:yes gene_type:complete